MYRNEQYVASKAKEKTEIKGYTVYLINMEVYHGLCALVFKNEHYITEDLNIWHHEEDEAKLREMYIDNLTHGLYTEEELGKVTDYIDYQAKAYFICNYYCNQVDHLSWVGTEITKDKYDMDADYDKLKKVYTVNNPVCIAYFKPQDKAFSDKIIELHNRLEKVRENESEEYMESAFLYEMGNHEYMINWQADWDVCSCFGECTYGESKDYRDYLKEMGKENLIPAYRRAKAKHYKLAEENDWY